METMMCRIGMASSTVPALALPSTVAIDGNAISSPRIGLSAQRWGVGSPIQVCRTAPCGGRGHGIERDALVVPRCMRAGVSTAEKVVSKESPEHFFEAVSSCSDPNGVFRVLDHELSERGGDDGKPFDWLAQWYPVGVLKHMDKRQPHAVTVLGRDLVMWWDQSGAQWQIFADVCPHRQAPLSEGRINEQGHLQCSYHGWAFAPSTGACTLIPQAPPEKSQVKESKRACAVVYETRQHQGLLFVYMDTKEGAKERAAANPPPLIPWLDDPNFVYDMGMSDMSYSYESLIENLLDPAHAPFAHHNLLAKRQTGKPLEFRVQRLGKAGFWGSRVDFDLSQIFVAPCVATSAFVLPTPPASGNPLAQKLRELFLGKEAMMFSTLFYCVPMTPGTSRIFFAFPRNFAKLVHHWTPGWMKHQLQMTILDSDMYLLHRMERQLEEGGGTKNIENLYYTPTAADAYVISFRRWLKKFGGTVPDYGAKASPRLPPTAPKTLLMDRSKSHVENCSFCSGAARNFKALETVLHVMPFVLLGLLVASNSKPLRSLSNFSIPIICLAVASSLGSRWLSKWIRHNFEFHDYNHALVK